MTGSRLAFLDLARCLGIGLMVFAHVTDALVTPLAWRSEFGQLYLAVRGITAPLFLVTSGWSFAVATLPSFVEHQRWGPALWARLRRAALLAGWGSALTLPWWAAGFPFHASLDAWLPSLSFGVLHCIAAALVLAQLLIRVSPSPRGFAIRALVLGSGLVVMAPRLQEWGSQLSPFYRGALFTGSFSGGFPLAPWAAYFLFGSSLGAFAWMRRLSPSQIALMAAGVAACSWGLGQLFELPAYRWLGTAPASASASLFLHRMTLVTAILACLALGSGVARVPSALQTVSKHALTFYVGHMLLLWGVPFVPGLQHRMGGALSFPAAAAVTATCLLGLWCLVWLRPRLSLRDLIGSSESPSAWTRAG